MRERIVETELHGDPVRVAGREAREPPFQIGVARAQHDELRGQPDQALRDVRDEVDALLRHQPANHAEQRRRGQRRETDRSAQRLAVRRLRVEAPRIVALRDQRIARGIPLVDVDAVQDAAQHVAPAAQQPVQAAAERFALDLARVARAHGGHGVRIGDAALEE